MSINGAAYKLATVVLSVYVFLVFYLVYLVFRPSRKSHGSQAWSSLIDLVVSGAGLAPAGARPRAHVCGRPLF